jgi:hypothetical protein
MQIGWKYNSLSYMKIEYLHIQFCSIRFAVRFSIRFHVALLPRRQKRFSRNLMFTENFKSSTILEEIGVDWCWRGNRTENRMGGSDLHTNPTENRMRNPTCRRPLSRVDALVRNSAHGLTAQNMTGQLKINY